MNDILMAKSDCLVTMSDTLMLNFQPKDEKYFILLAKYV